MNTASRPDWLKIKHRQSDDIASLRKTAKSLKLATVCQEANCPNLFECWSEGTATFMLMGDTCTRGCRFCNVTTGNPNGWLDADEPQKLADTIAEAGWSYVVLTAVDRDDLPDGGATHMAKCIQAVLQRSPHVNVEVLAPDFAGDFEALRVVLDSGLHVFAHNVETVKRLQRSVRDRRANYQQSLDILKAAKAMRPELLTKTSIMLGLGETEDEILDCFADLRAIDVDAITLGHYLQPSPKHLPVAEWVPEEQFVRLKELADTTYGFKYCASGPLVRSSYRAGEHYLAAMLESRKQ